MPTAIKFENISKQYRLGLVSTQTLSHDLNRWWKMNVRGQEDPYLKIGDVNDRSIKGESDYVWALKNIDFEVQQGEVLGIIGKNGAGKSTLLKILSKVTAPSTGTIKAAGRIASLLEVGTGFHPEMTGRENIYMNGAIMGMTKAEITRKLDEIIDFSGVERYIDTPAKRYSSGMTVRLGFAIAAYLEPEILVVDEVLAVGDAEFQKKAIGKMQDISTSDGRTVLFVSHNMAAVKQLCNHCVILKNGEVDKNGVVDSMISEYLTTDTTENAHWKTTEQIDSEIFFEEISILNSKKQNTYVIESEESFTVNLKLICKKKIINSTIAIRFVNSEGVPVFTTTLHDNNSKLDGIELGENEYNVNISPNILVPGKYDLVIACFVSRTKLYHQVEDITIVIEDLGTKRRDLDRQGFILPLYDWNLIR